VEIFNYLNVMIAILLGVGLFQIFGGIGHLLQVRHRVTSYWLHSFWVLILILAHAHLWWSFWGLRDMVKWNYLEFLYLLIGPSGLVIVSQIIVPGEFYADLHEQKFDLKQYYYDIRVLFFSIFTAVISWAILLEPVLGIKPRFIEIPILQALALLAIGGCAISKRQLVHHIAVLVILALLVAVVLVRFQPQSISSQ
jgi:hypothetical protein